MCFGSGGSKGGSDSAYKPAADGGGASSAPTMRPPGGGAVGDKAFGTSLLSNGSATDPAKPKTLLGG